MGDAAADDDKLGNTSSAWVDNPKRLTCFGNQEFAEPPVDPEKCIGGVLVDEGADAPKPYLVPVEMRMQTSVAGDLLLTGSASTTMRVIFSRRPLPWSFCEKTKRKSNGTTTHGINFNQFVPSCRRKTIELEIRPHLGFYPGGCLGRLYGCQFLGGRRVLLG